MAVTGQQIADDAWALMSDTNGGTGVRWQTAEVLRGINRGQLEVVSLHPQANTKSAKAAMLADTRQTLAGMGLTDGIQVLRLLRNWSADGNTVGRAITRVSMAQLDAERPDWHAEEAASAVEHFDLDPLDPASVYVYPKPIANLRAEVIYSAVPADLASLASNLSLPDIYRNPVTYFLLSHMLSKRVQGSANARAEAAGYYNQMVQSLGLRQQVLLGTDQVQRTKGAEA